MKKFSLSPVRILGVVVLLGTLTTGCSPRPVQILAVNGPDSLVTDQPGNFQAVTNEEAKPPVFYDWSFQDNSAASSGNPVSHVFREPGTYNVMVTATNRKGKSSDTGQTTVIVVDPPQPAQVVTISADPMDPDTRTEVRFSSLVRGDEPLRYNWSFGDGMTGTGASPTHIYTEQGTYTVTLNATNDVGSDARSLTISVSAYEADFCAELADMNAIFFERNSSVLNAEAEAVLRENIDILQSCPNLNVRLEGHSDPLERNPQRLSDDRARAVEQFYLSNSIAQSRIQSLGMGAGAPGTTKSGASQLRRVDTIPLRTSSSR